MMGDYLLKKSLITESEKLKFNSDNLKKTKNFNKIIDATNKLLNYMLVTKKH